MSALTRIANALEAASHAPAAAQKSYLLASLAGVTVTSMILQKSIAKTGPSAKLRQKKALEAQLAKAVKKH